MRLLNAHIACYGITDKRYQQQMKALDADLLLSPLVILRLAAGHLLEGNSTLY